MKMNKIIIALFFLICSISVLANPILTSNPKEKRVSLIGGLIKNLQYKGGLKRNIFFNNWKRILDVYYDKKSKTPDHPVVILIHGGGWVSGDKVKYTDVASFFADNGYVAVVPDYILFPYGQVEDMIEDVYKAIEWTFNNVAKYGGDVNNVSIIAHSAGAHLVSLAMLKSTLKLKNKGKVLDTLPTIRKAVLLNGMYDFDVYESYVRACEDDIDNGLVERFAELLLGSNLSSPTDIVRDYKESLNSTLIGADTLNIVSNANDTVIPMKSATGLVNALEKTNTTSNVNYFLIEGGHAYIIDGIMSRETKQCELIMEYLNTD